MDAKKCDRCGQFYIKNKKFKHSSIGENVYISGVNIIGNDDEAIIESYDLCDKCLKKLMKLLKEYK